MNDKIMTTAYVNGIADSMWLTDSQLPDDKQCLSKIVEFGKELNSFAEIAVQAHISNRNKSEYTFEEGISKEEQKEFISNMKNIDKMALALPAIMSIQTAINVRSDTRCKSLNL
ncbi:MAG: hypothetical protein L3J88_12350 [Gammaproteobacteria bacterium]|nr:hypothetical protein [Gammaproteobacteria bacterium]